MGKLKKADPAPADAARRFTELQAAVYGAHARGDAEAFEAARVEMQALQQQHAGLRVL